LGEKVEIFGQKSYCLDKNENFGEKSKFWGKIPIFGKMKIFEKIEIMEKNKNFREKSIF